MRRRDFLLGFPACAAVLSSVRARAASKQIDDLDFHSVLNAVADVSAADAQLTPDVMVPMRDGVGLATDIYRPVQGGKFVEGAFPVLLIRTPYNKSIYDERLLGRDKPLDAAAAAEMYVRRGYVLVIQDCRGRFKSGGEFTKYVGEGPDGVDTCAWLLKQSWCNGKIGTFGGSYLAHVQSAMAALGAPGLAAMYLECGGFSNAYQAGARQGGTYELKQVTWAVNSMVDSPLVVRDPVRLKAAMAIDIKAWFQSMPWKRGHSPLTPAPDFESYVFDQWEHGEFDEFWKQPSIYWAGFYDKSPGVTTLHMSGWYDPYARTATENYVGLRKIGRDTRLIMGPWTHTASQVSHSGDAEFGPHATLDGNLAEDFPTLRLRFFDQYLKGKSAATEELPRVQLFVMGGGSGRRNAEGRIEHGGQWRTEKDWPIGDTIPTQMYIRPDGSLSRTVPSNDAPPISFDFDPANPVPTIGGTLPGHKPFEINKGGFDQREEARFFGSKAPYLPLDARPDILVFQTETIGEDMEVTGPIVANLWISSDRPDTDFTIKLIDVYPASEDYPDGFALNLTDGIMRVRYRKSWEKPEMLQPGEIAEVRVEAFPTSNLFKKGHRIRLDISSSNFPHFDVNPNTGGPQGKGLERNVARNSVYASPRYPSHIVLPVIPARSNRTA